MGSSPVFGVGHINLPPFMFSFISVFAAEQFLHQRHNCGKEARLGGTFSGGAIFRETRRDLYETCVSVLPPLRLTLIASRTSPLAAFVTDAF